VPVRTVVLRRQDAAVGQVKCHVDAEPPSSWENADPDPAVTDHVLEDEDLALVLGGCLAASQRVVTLLAFPW